MTGTRPFHVVGFTGLPSSGKGEATKALLDLARGRGWRAEHLVFSDRIREEARRRGIPDAEFTREMLSQIGIEMRQAEGPGVLAGRLVCMIESWPGPRPELFVTDGVRHIGEVDTLRRAYGKKFHLVAVDSEPWEIARRLIARCRPDESPDAMRSEEDAIRLLEQELQGKLSALGPNVGECIAKAEYVLPNHGTLEDLRKETKRLFDIIADETPRRNPG